MTTTDFKLTRTADQTGKTTRNQSTNASFFVITASDNSLIPIIEPPRLQNSILKRHQLSMPFPCVCRFLSSDTQKHNSET